MRPDGVRSDGGEVGWGEVGVSDRKIRRKKFVTILRST